MDEATTQEAPETRATRKTRHHQHSPSKWRQTAAVAADAGGITGPHRRPADARGFRGAGGDRRTEARDRADAGKAARAELRGTGAGAGVAMSGEESVAREAEPAAAR